MYEIAKATRGFDSDMAYPQYKHKYMSWDVISVQTWTRLQQYVRDLLNDKASSAPNTMVRSHMVTILGGVVPFNMRIVE